MCVSYAYILQGNLWNVFIYFSMSNLNAELRPRPLQSPFLPTPLLILEQDLTLQPCGLEITV